MKSDYVYYELNHKNTFLKECNLHSTFQAHHLIDSLKIEVEDIRRQLSQTKEASIKPITKSVFSVSGWRARAIGALRAKEQQIKWLKEWINSENEIQFHDRIKLGETINYREYKFKIESQLLADFILSLPTEVDIPQCVMEIVCKVKKRKQSNTESSELSQN